MCMESCGDGGSRVPAEGTQPRARVSFHPELLAKHISMRELMGPPVFLCDTLRGWLRRVPWMCLLSWLARAVKFLPLSLRTAGGYVAQGEFASSLPWCFWTAGGFFSFTKVLCWTCFSKSDNYLKDFLVAQRVKNLPAMQMSSIPGSGGSPGEVNGYTPLYSCLESPTVRSLGQEDPLEKWMATHSCILAWRVPRTEEPGGLQSMGSQSIDTTEWRTLSELRVILLCCQPHCPGCGKEFGFLGPPPALLNLGWSQESLPHLVPDPGLVNKRTEGLWRRPPGSTGHISCPRDVTDWDEDLPWLSSPVLPVLVQECRVRANWEGPSGCGVMPEHGLSKPAWA